MSERLLNINFDEVNSKIQKTTSIYVEGKVSKVIGLTIEVEGIKAFVGELCKIYNESNEPINCEVVGFRDKNVLLMPLDEVNGISEGCKVIPQRRPLDVNCSDDLLGKVLDGLGNPYDDIKIKGHMRYALDNDPPDPLRRKRN